MVPCPWFLEIADYASRNASADLGVHITLTSERALYRWGPVLSRERVPTLVDQHGYFHNNVAAAIARLDPREAKAEMRAQIERAYLFGIRPTHLDSHQAIHHLSRPLFESLRSLGREFDLPILVTNKTFVRCDFRPIVRREDIVLDQVITISRQVPPNLWDHYYTTVISQLQPGVSQLIIHPAYDDSEMQALTGDRPSWGAAWRQRDFDYFTNPRLPGLLDAHSIELISWRQLVPKALSTSRVDS